MPAPRSGTKGERATVSGGGASNRGLRRRRQRRLSAQGPHGSRAWSGPLPRSWVYSCALPGTSSSPIWNGSSSCHITAGQFWLGRATRQPEGRQDAARSHLGSGHGGALVARVHRDRQGPIRGPRQAGALAPEPNGPRDLWLMAGGETRARRAALSQAGRRERACAGSTARSP